MHTFANKRGDVAGPNHELWKRRVMAVRRTWHKQPQFRVATNEIHQFYEQNARIGICQSDMWTLGPMPRRCYGQAASPWVWEAKPVGFIGILLQHAAQRGCAIEQDWAFCATGRPRADLLNHPLEHLREVVRQANTEADFAIVHFNTEAFSLRAFIDVKAMFAHINSPIEVPKWLADIDHPTAAEQVKNRSYQQR